MTRKNLIASQHHLFKTFLFLIDVHKTDRTISITEKKTSNTFRLYFQFETTLSFEIFCRRMKSGIASARGCQCEFPVDITFVTFWWMRLQSRTVLCLSAPSDRSQTQHQLTLTGAHSSSHGVN